MNIENNMISIQQQYKDLLINTKNKIQNPDNLIFILEEIKNFWYINRNIVETYMLNIANDFDTYILMGASYLDIPSNKHFPFITFGKKHIIDDPVAKFLQFLEKLPKGDFYQEYLEIINKSIDDNLSILENYTNFIKILPLTMFNAEDKQELKQIGENIFFQLFKQKYLSIDDFLNKNKTIYDIDKNIIQEIKNSIIFDEQDDSKLSFIDRFNNFIKVNNFPYKDKLSDSSLFFSIIISYFMQSVHIFQISEKYNTVPFIRSKIPYNYSYLLKSIFDEDIILRSLLFRSQCCFVLNEIFNPNWATENNFISYKNKLLERNFDQIFFSKFNDFNNSYKEIYAFLFTEIESIFEEIS